jgi:hypothetical protein
MKAFMEHQLFVTTAFGPARRDGQRAKTFTLDPGERSPQICLWVETRLGLAVDEDFPDSFDGKIIDLTREQCFQIRTGKNVEVGLWGKRYKFGSLEPDGTCKLRKDW